MTHNGLLNEAAQARLRQYGPNALPERPPTPLWRRFARQFQSPLIYILLCALVADAAIWVSEGATGLPVESIAIAVILLLNAGLGVYQESKSEAALARLKEMAAPMVWVMREGRLVHLPSAELVPGDVARVEAGDRVPADGSLIEAGGVMIDESVLTGESAPVDKALNEEVFSGTLLVRGKGYVEISRTGEKSAMGRLAVMIGGIEAEKTPLERRLEKFGGQIARGVLALAMLIAVGGLLVDGLERIGHVFLFAVALAVAAVPEGLPAVLTLTLAYLFIRALPVLSFDFLFKVPVRGMRAGGVWPALLGTIYLVLISLAVATPIGVLAAVYLNEYAKENYFTRVVNLAVVNLAGVPSIVHALFGLGAFVVFAGIGRSILAASLTLAIMTLPVIIASAKEALAAVPRSFREACWNVGASRWQTIRHVVLPNSVSGILTGVILQVSRTAGETAPVMFTGAVFYKAIKEGDVFAYGLFDQCMALSMRLFTVSTQVPDVPEALPYGTAVVLLATVLAVNALAIAFRVYLRSRKKW